MVTDDVEDKPVAILFFGVVFEGLDGLANEGVTHGAEGVVVADGLLFVLEGHVGEVGLFEPGDELRWEGFVAFY